MSGDDENRIPCGSFWVLEEAMTTPSELRRKADLFRRIKRFILDSQAVRAIGELVSEFEMTAEQLERRQRIRQRAHEIWVAQGRPQGRDVENWLKAERELK